MVLATETVSRDPNASFIGETCECGRGKYVNTSCFNSWWVTCNDCDRYVFCYVPMEHQMDFHLDQHKIKMYSGGFGSAKTSTVGAEFVTLALNTPNGVGLVGASTYPQLEQTSKKQVLDMLPDHFIEHIDKKNNVWYLTNGYEILFRSFDDEQKLRSLNLAHIWMEEANSTDFSIFTQLQTRLRHHSTDYHRLLISTNPDMNWIRQEVLMKSHEVIGASEDYVQNKEDINKNISTHIAATSRNTFLPPNYVEDLRAGKPDWWISRYLEGSFNFSEGAVYPHFASTIVDIDPNEIRNNIRTKGWKVIVGGDFGIRDNTVQLMAALDPVEGIVYVYNEYVANRVGIPTHARAMKKNLEHVPQGLLMKLMGDPSGKRKNLSDNRSVFDHYAEYGIYWTAADNRLDTGIMKVYSYIEMGKLKVLGHLKETIGEHLKYVYKPTDLGDKIDEKPVDRDNHTCFIAGMRVRTSEGLVPIEEIKIGDYVLTRRGYKRVYDSAMTGKNKELYKLTTSNGQVVIGTGNHPMITRNRGKISLANLRYDDILIPYQSEGESLCTKKKLSYLKGTTTQDSLDIQTLEEVITTETLETKNKTDTCTEKFINIIKGKYQKDGQSITSTMTHLIMKLKTWFRYLEGNTRGFTYKMSSIQTFIKWNANSVERSLKQRSYTMLDFAPTTASLQVGENQKLIMKNENVLDVGISLWSTSIHQQHTVPSHVRSKMSTILENQEPVSNVARRMWRQAYVKSSVIKIALLNLIEKKEDTQTNENVSYVEQNLLQEMTALQKRVPEVVPIRVEKLPYRADVYNISVEDEHEFFIEGILTVNCDTLRYMIQELPDDPLKLKTETYGADSRSLTDQSQAHLPYALQSNEDNTYFKDSWSHHY